MHITSDLNFQHYKAPAAPPLSLHMHGEQDGVMLLSRSTQHNPLPVAEIMRHGLVMPISLMNDFIASILVVDFLYVK